MSIAFDLISDLHVETWSEPFDWSGQATAPFAIVAGDVCRDPQLLKQVMTNIAENYRAVFYIDGNDEHRYNLENVNDNYPEMIASLQEIPDLVFCQENVVIMDGVAVIGANGWWDYGFDPNIEIDQSVQWCADRYKISQSAAVHITGLAHTDAIYLQNTVKKLQTYSEVEKIVVVTHTVPKIDLVNHDIELMGTHRINTTGCSVITSCLDVDLEKKIHTWCFGHYHHDVDRMIDGIRYVSNPRGRGGTPWCKQFYYPRRIEINN